MSSLVLWAGPAKVVSVGASFTSVMVTVLVAVVVCAPLGPPEAFKSVTVYAMVRVADVWVGQSLVLLK